MRESGRGAPGARAETRRAGAVLHAPCFAHSRSTSGRPMLRRAAEPTCDPRELGPPRASRLRPSFAPPAPAHLRVSAGSPGAS